MFLTTTIQPIQPPVQIVLPIDNVSIAAPVQVAIVDTVATVDFRDINMPVRNAQVSECGTEHMYFNGHLFRNLPRAGSYVQMDANLEAAQNRSYYLTLDHCSTMVGGIPNAKISIAINGKVVVSGYNSNNGGFIREQVDITPYVQSGSNTIRVSLDGDSIARYWIKEISLSSLTKH